jgi:transposase
MEIGECCRDSTNKAVARKFGLHEHTVKRLDIQYMRILLAKQPTMSPIIIGVDEIAIRKGHRYRIVVSDLVRERPIWVGKEGRKEADFQVFFDKLGEKKSMRITLSVMDMWVAFRNGVEKNCPNVDILYDKFHVMKHLNEALDEIRKQEYRRVSEKQGKYIKGQRFILLSRYKNLDATGKQSLNELFTVNRRLYKAYLLKEQFSQLWDYKTETWARKFFENWKRQLRWQRLEPFVKFARMIDKHWEGIVSHCELQHNIKLGYVEGANNKIKVIQKQAYGYRDDEYLELKILTAFLPRK